MPNNGSPLVGSNLSCIRQINLMMQSAFAEVICISILFQVCIHQGNCYRFIIKRTIVYSSFVQNSISFGCSLPIFPAFAAGLICKP